LSEYAGDSGFFIAFLHSIKAWRARAAQKPTPVTVASDSKFSPEFTNQVPEMTKHSRSVT
jgi:hypothetical protein